MGRKKDSASPEYFDNDKVKNNEKHENGQPLDTETEPKNPDIIDNGLDVINSMGHKSEQNVASDVKDCQNEGPGSSDHSNRTKEIKNVLYRCLANICIIIHKQSLFISIKFLN